ncbi:MAG: hypothetical protein A2Z69_00270 [Bacteroidetes bacterium RBG_13_44_24]|nr:MAG: hypothetical protein A2Z69_00270 [Bacteroidetes bacterium RBG_13_44_24]
MGRNIGIDTRSVLAPLLIKVIGDALIPKEQQKVQQRQMALEALAHYQPTVSGLPQEEKENFYNQFFRAYGMYQPQSSLRRLFGASPEPVIPLPKGGEMREHPGIFGQTVYTIPQAKPFGFKKAPIFPEEHITEMKERGMGEEDISEAFETKVTGVKPPPSTKTLRKVARLRASGQSIPPDLEEEYNDLMRQKEIAENLKKLQGEELVSKGEARKEKVALEKTRESRYADQFKQTMALNEKKFAAVNQQHRDMLKMRGLDRQTALFINMTKARVDQELEAMTEHNKREQHSKDLDPGYIPQFISSSPILSQWEDLYSKVMSFGGREESERQPAPHPGGNPPSPTRVTPPPSPRNVTPKDQLIKDLWR